MVIEAVEEKRRDLPTFLFNEAIKRNPESFRGSRRISCFSLAVRSSTL